MTELATTPQAKAVHEAFIDDVMRMPAGEKIKICQQCGTCTGSCPTSYLMDYGPREVIAAFRAGMIDKVIKSNTIWLCTSCYYCTVRCPAGIKITDLMYELKRLGMKYDILPAGSKNPAMTRYFIDSVHRHGRNHEVELIGKFVMTKNPGLALKFTNVGAKLFFGGRLPLFAKNIRGRDELTRISAYLEAEEAKVQEAKAR
jgi:heterodisulfide reductase subunit C